MSIPIQHPVSLMSNSFCSQWWQKSIDRHLYHCLYWHLKDHRIYFPDKVKCLLYVKISTSSMAGHYLARVGLVCWCSTNMVLGISCQAITAKLSSDHLLSYGQTPLWLHPYSSINFVSVLSHCLISISLAALVHILAFPVRVSVMPLYIQAELIKMCNVILIPFIMATNLC